MHHIKVNAIDSTNSFAREMFKEKPSIAATCITAKEQLKGRGQRGTTWSTKPGQNLTFSIIWPKPAVFLANQFQISAVVSTAIVEGLEKMNVPRLKVKWPNDIMAANLKIAGILIENVITEGNISASIIGVGLNVNQTDFKHLSTAASMKLVTGRHFDLDEVQDSLLPYLENALQNMKDVRSEIILKRYQERLFRINIPSTFQLPDLTLFTGIIAGVSQNGKLLVRREDDVLQEFDLKEIKLCF
ncbi:biotin--[acetyl-CoA-carboxylase] ligase [Salinimicrobium sp. GXAS 041]|uniref:biotin--[acetyl-CoA-carboxylase] ligase n=1 Tax=Salinimicrobium sp. GXAS 041 TaxID=3400806 RepID=UPI003C77713F